MEKKFLSSTDTFLSMYQKLVSEHTESRYRKIVPLDELWENINVEGFVRNLEDNPDVDPMFINKLYSFIIKSYANNGYGAGYLNQMWKVFAKLEDNGILPIDKKEQALYIRLAAENIPSSGLGSERDVLNESKFLVAGLDSFDTSQYFFSALNQLKKHRDRSATYAYYADFVKTLSDVSYDEKLLYVLLAEQIQNKEVHDKGWWYEGETLKKSTEILRDQLYYGNHYVFSDIPEQQFFGEKIEDLIKKHDKSYSEYRDDSEAKGEYPTLIKKPSKRRFVTEKNNYYTTDSHIW